MPERSASDVALRVRDLKKRFGATIAVDGLSFDVHAGELVGLIGPNGAGKSTTIKILTGQLLADEGTAALDGHDIVEEPLAARRLLGYVPQELALLPFITGRETLDFVARVRGIAPADADPRIDDLLARFQLVEAQNRMAREYSEGMARKLAIAVALLGEPSLLVLDESLNGLDPRAAAEVKAVVEARRAAGTGVLLVSHTLEVMERMCTRVVLVHRGRVISTLDRAGLDALTGSGRTLEDHFLEHTG